MLAEVLETYTPEERYSMSTFLDGVESYFGYETRLAISRDSTVHDGNLVLNELHLYGSSRLGMMQMQDTLFHYTAMTMYDLGSTYTPLYSTATITQPTLFDSVFVHQRGRKVYEGTNHLGNILVTYTDKRLTECLEDTIYRYVADVKSQTDYSAFGVLLEERQWYANADSGGYRYGFQNQEKDDEVKGFGNSINYRYRMHDPRLGRFFAADPLAAKYPFYSTYAFSGNRVIDAVEQEGLQPEKVIEPAEDYQGTPYEFGGKAPAFKNGIPKEMTEEYYLNKVGVISSLNGYGSRYNNPNYTNEENLNQYLTNGARSCGIDCSGLTSIAFNSDEEKLMPNFDVYNQGASAQRKAFRNAENNVTGYLGTNFQGVVKGDLVFNASATHVMVATGEVRTNSDGETEIKVIHAPETGRYVTTEWRKVGKNWTFGHTYRTTEYVSPEVEIRSDKP